MIHGPAISVLRKRRKTTIDSPILSFALFSITPNPVVIAQPNKAAIRGSVSFGTLVHLFSLIIAWVLNVVTHPAFKIFPFQTYLGVSD